ncbi:BON domain-containing protein [Cellvibrio mixtus]|uniref:BON domain-containing protein n=1 Tax=Cellvibrio mixtus TaxID=39650 RepID=UPI000586E225|nr:BON domain-containing protein [Cellvibrio mixtus]
MKAINYSITAIFLAFILAVTGCASTSKEKSTGEIFDDAVITTKVKAAFVEDDELKATEIQVETFKGVVQLSGFVADRSHIGKAEQVARDVRGVKSVKNDIRVK